MTSKRSSPVAVLAALTMAGCTQGPAPAPLPDTRSWLAGDHHVHSAYSVEWKGGDATTAPTPVIGGDGRYSILVNATMAKENGLAWMVATDHGGPNHSKLNFEKAYPDLELAREQIADLIQFYGMEFDTPGADHSSLIIPHTPAERNDLRDVESRFSKREEWPPSPARDSEPKMLEALAYLRAMQSPPVVVANHPSRSAKVLGGYGQDTPAELRAWNDAAPGVAIGMEGAPGHQASALNPDASLDPGGARGGYDEAPTMGGFDPMTARLGGFWDAMLGEGRRWWITSTSDSHRHWKDGGSDFWPGEYSKTYVRAERTYDDVLDGLRKGRIFVVTGDLVSELDLTISAPGQSAGIGGGIDIPRGQDIRVTIRVRDPAGANHAGRDPAIARIDLITGEVKRAAGDPTSDRNPSTKVIKRFTADAWIREGDVLTMSWVIQKPATDGYVRIRGTNTQELEPLPDPKGEDPWQDLWFYSNPVFFNVR